MAHEALIKAYRESRSPDRDDVDAAAVEPTTYRYALEFITLLPTTAPAPDVYADQDGEITFEWDHGPRRVFSVSVGRDGTLNYAGLFGHNKSHGVEHLVEAIPLAILANLARVAPETFTGSGVR
jgi:hypothetical protein